MRFFIGKNMIYFEGSDDIDNILKSLDTLEEKLQKKTIRSSLVYVAKPIKKDMKTLAPKKSGLLAASINHKQLTKTKKQRVGISDSDAAIIVGPNKKINGSDVAWRANFIEEGVRSHEINSKVTKKLGRSLKLKIGNRVLSGDVVHPGLKANPFMEKSIRQNESNIEERFYQGMAKSLDRIRTQ